ncbi:hypothetical protein GCM10010191_52690 [Actinomadura vinacea]|uniref:Chitin-binding type-4 domain-containing protein n=1 Tax=Actinomadura vinacea TaxID=115336 RepID=A0ABN3JMM6_9ACTN
MSRASACGGPYARSDACQAAEARSGAALARWDDVRVPDVRGRDRQMIPDGRLCSGGIARFAGLDLPRADWPATTLTGAARQSFRYRVSIPHRGGFRLYVTRDGYRPGRTLTWDDLEPEPFLAVTDPPRRNGVYEFSGRLPEGKTGRHVIYTVWQTSDTPDTYYSCSDVNFGASRSNTPIAVDVPPRPGPQNTAGPSAAGPSAEMLVAAGGGVALFLLFAMGLTAALLHRRRPTDPVPVVRA